MLRSSSVTTGSDPRKVGKSAWHERVVKKVADHIGHGIEVVQEIDCLLNDDIRVSLLEEQLEGFDGLLIDDGIRIDLILEVSPEILQLRE
jgi:hypothetical protein